MVILQPAFNILMICGCWRPSFCRTTCNKAAYLIYTIFVVLVLHTFCISQFLNVILNVRTANELSESFYMFIATLLSCCKIITLLVNHRNIENLGRKLEEEPCKPISTEEVIIQNKFDRNIGSITIYYTILVELTVICMILSSLLTDFNEKKLAYRAWLPFDYSVPSYYYIAYVHQIVGLIGTSLLNVACDVTVCGLFVHICGQQEILKHRLKKMTLEQRPNIGKIVRFHDYLYGYVFMMQKKFKWIIGVQLVSSTFVVCFILYELANTSPMSSKYLQFVLYLACMMTQIFFYCWYGNQLKLKSIEIVNAIFEMNWISLNNSIKKDLIIIMKRAMMPIELTCAYVFTIDLNTFVNLLKMSYSTYNLLQRKKES
ncbi:Odorant receptor 94b [Anthophora plagiata]